ncbi:ATP-grasp domain-containing protein [Solwaraspora sp. WMMB335]|uniref:ATP-grasp domain-containing protein n=1 Tax=Solwaraspora sp. WMMB335 TaxID=3404118 RepID=UPI003B928359
MSTSEHVVIINRWAEHYAQFTRYLDHQAHRVTYVSTEVGLSAVPTEATEVVTVRATDDLAEVTSAVDGLARRHGAPDRIVALKEDDLLVGAALRDRWAVPGPRVDDLLPFRDKFLMATRVAKAGVPLPEFELISDEQAVHEFAGRVGWPVIVKPTIGSSSAGVVRIDGPHGVFPIEEPQLAQAFNPHQIYHVDGVFTGERLLVMRASRYLNNCLDFRSGGMLGSVEESDPAINEIIAEFALRVMCALSDLALVFHLEMFFDAEAGNCAFLEVGARVGGAEIPLLWREVHGHDLMKTAFRIQLGLGVGEETPHLTPEIGGWLLAPAPAHRPCRITETTPMVGRDPGPYAEVLLKVGEILPDADSYYEHVGGRFRFRGPSTQAVETAVRAIAAEFRVSGQPVAQAKKADQTETELG